ncbi:hypothetical protein [Belnapia rosea]|uniref:Uncharacterized protein n=1 Tax=Belnapia rosea TaxID=938405 RepID=A0A1G6Z0P0_9PROT|nr:hypothetical protein [Belnapia rosea]SDD96314.1 hypothetical protein SAMN04487779_101584 [Belnapia rosea]
MRLLIVILGGILTFFGLFFAIVSSVVYLIVATAAATFMCMALISFALYLLTQDYFFLHSTIRMLLFGSAPFVIMVVFGFFVGTAFETRHVSRTSRRLRN